MWENLGALFRTSTATVSAAPVQTDLLLETKPWFRTIFSELPGLFAPKPVYVLSAQPVAVSPLFRDYRFRKRSAMFSVTTHFLLVAAILWLPGWFVSSEKPKKSPEVLTQLTTEPLFLDPASQTKEVRRGRWRRKAGENSGIAGQAAALLGSTANAADTEDCKSEARTAGGADSSRSSTGAVATGQHSSTGRSAGHSRATFQRAWNRRRDWNGYRWRCGAWQRSWRRAG